MPRSKGMDEKDIKKIIAYDSPTKLNPKIKSFREYYTGRMYVMIAVEGNDQISFSLSHPGDFGDGQRALIHIEDGKNYKDMLYPSLRILKEEGESQMISNFMTFAKDGGKVIETSLSFHEEAAPKEILVGKKDTEEAST